MIKDLNKIISENSNTGNNKNDLLSLDSNNKNKKFEPHLLTQFSDYIPNYYFMFDSFLDFIAVNYKNKIILLLRFLESTISRMKEDEKIFFAHRLSERLISIKNPNTLLIQCCLLVMSQITSSSNFKNLLLMEQVFKINKIFDYDEYLEYFLTVLDDEVLTMSDVEPKNIWYNNYQDELEFGVIKIQNQLKKNPESIFESKFKFYVYK